MRSRVLRHLDVFFRPPVSFYNEIEAAIELAAAGRLDDEVELNGGRCPVRELVERYCLTDLIEWLEVDALLDPDEWDRRRAAEEAERDQVYRDLGVEPPW